MFNLRSGPAGGIEEYVCPKCGHFNPSARAMRETRSNGNRLSPSPQRPPYSALPPQSALSPMYGLLSAVGEAPTQDLPVPRSPSRASSTTADDIEHPAQAEGDKDAQMEVDS